MVCKRRKMSLKRMMIPNRRKMSLREKIKLITDDETSKQINNLTNFNLQSIYN